MKSRLSSFLVHVMQEVYEIIEPKIKINYHNTLQKNLVNSAVFFNSKGVPEYRISKVKGYENRVGKIDVVWLDTTENPYVAIEIDSGLRKKSMMKLLSSNAEYKVQIYYGERTETEIELFKKRCDPKNEIIFLHSPLKLLKRREIESANSHSLFDFM
ncbi:hypothetical protein [Bacillus sp. CGMCC 1.16541]|uniref:hypothetical protein n=1 Tax=Bacillus sp. CGMCC 1.16541 TaxID=2185143 RepID=UPI000D732FB9|nr:hypothetical protein [Bacillus sp. CGMCC 1.16541]